MKSFEKTLWVGALLIFTAIGINTSTGCEEPPARMVEHDTVYVTKTDTIRIVDERAFLADVVINEIDYRGKIQNFKRFAIAYDAYQNFIYNQATKQKK